MSAYCHQSENFLSTAGETNIMCNELMPGMRLEAVDRIFPELISVATIAQVAEDGLLQIHFDGWPSDFDYTCAADSPDIAPIGTAERLGLKLEPPGRTHDFAYDSWVDGGCTWTGYLREIRATAAPVGAFAQKIRLNVPRDSTALLNVNDACQQLAAAWSRVYHEHTRDETRASDTATSSMVERWESLMERAACTVARSVVQEKLSLRPCVATELRGALPEECARLCSAARACPMCARVFVVGYSVADFFTSSSWMLKCCVNRPQCATAAPSAAHISAPQAAAAAFAGNIVPEIAPIPPPTSLLDLPRYIGELCVNVSERLNSSVARRVFPAGHGDDMQCREMRTATVCSLRCVATSLWLPRSCNTDFALRRVPVPLLPIDGAEPSANGHSGTRTTESSQPCVCDHCRLVDAASLTEQRCLPFIRGSRSRRTHLLW